MQSYNYDFDPFERGYDRQTDKLTEISCYLADVCNASATNLPLSDRQTTVNYKVAAL